MPSANEGYPQLQFDIVKDAGIRLYGTASRKSCQRFAQRVRAVWRRIPKCDRRWMTCKWKDLAQQEDYLLCIDYRPSPVGKSSACVFLDKSVMWIESRVMERCDDERIEAIIAHEFGHLRAYADLDWPDEGEAIANLYARHWGFKDADSVYTTDECIELEQFARSLNYNWQIFQYEGALGTYFIDLHPLAKLKRWCTNNPLGWDYDEARSTLEAIAYRRDQKSGSKSAARKKK